MNQSDRYRETHWRYCSLTLIHRNEYVNSLAVLVFDLSGVNSLIGSLFGLASNFQRKHQISATLPLCVGNPPVTGWFRSDKDLSHRWFEMPWPSCDVTVLWYPVCACTYISIHRYSRVTLYTAGHLHTAVPHCSHSRAPIVHTAVPRENNEHGCVYLRCRAVCKLPGCVEGHPWYWDRGAYHVQAEIYNIITLTEFNCWGANATGWHHYINLHGDNSHRAKRINVKTF